MLQLDNVALHQSTRRRFGVTFLVVLSCFLLVGCQSAGMPSDAPQISQADQVERPIDRFMPSADDVIGLSQTTQQEVNDCLSQNGISETFAYPPEADLRSFLDTVIADRVLRSDLWGFFGDNSVDNWGYQHPEGTTSISVAPLSAEGAAACGQLIEPPNDPIFLFHYGSLPEGGPPVATDDEGYQAAVAQWRDCMAEQGYTYADPIEAVTAFQEERAPSERQIETAKADVACKVSTNLVGIGLRAQARVDDQYIADHEKGLVAFEESTRP